MELFDDFGQTREVTLVKTQLAQLREEEERRITGGTRKEGEDGKRGEVGRRGRITGGTRKEGGGGWGKRRSRKKREDYRGDKKGGRGRMRKEEK